MGNFTLFLLDLQIAKPLNMIGFHVTAGPLTNIGRIPQIEASEAFQALLFSVLSDMKATN